MDDSSLRNHCDFIASWPDRLREACHYVESCSKWLKKPCTRLCDHTTPLQVLNKFRSNYTNIVAVWATLVYGQPKSQITTKHKLYMDLKDLDILIDFIANHKDKITSLYLESSRAVVQKNIETFQYKWQSTGPSILITCSAHFIYITDENREKTSDNGEKPGYCHDRKPDEIGYGHPVIGEAEDRVNTKIKWSDHETGQKMPRYASQSGFRENRKAPNQLLQEKEEELEELEEERTHMIDRMAEFLGEKHIFDLQGNICSEGIKQQPIRIKETFQQLIGRDWIRAKKDLDKMVAISDKDKFQVLNNICKLAYIKVTQLQDHQNKLLKAIAQNPLEFTKGNPSTHGLLDKLITEADSDPLPYDLRLVISRHQRMNAHKVDWTTTAERVLTEALSSVSGQMTTLSGQMTTVSDQMSSVSGHPSALLHLATALTSLSWTMCNQLPPMTFQWPSDYNPLLVRIAERSDSSAIDILYYVHPCLYHGDVMILQGAVVR